MKSLLIPFRVEALVLEEEKEVISNFWDFTKLPGYLSDGSILNPTTPFLGQKMAISSNTKIKLPSGVHLHFIMPDYLSQTSEYFDNEYPPIPNRWVVRRLNNETVEKEWLIESDYVFPEGTKKEDTVNACVIPMPIGYDEDGKPLKQLPFRYMGRQTINDSSFDFENQASLQKNEGESSFSNLYKNELTIIGYGDINFASFYPNCLGSLGFYDNEITTVTGKISYEVAGYYSEDKINLDIVKKVKDSFLKEYGGINSTSNNEDLKKRLSDKVQLEIEDNELVPERTFLSAKIKLDGKPVEEKVECKKIAIGKTGTEAISALLAQGTEGDKKENESILESILLYPRLNGVKDSFDYHFSEQRHNKGFTAHQKTEEIIWKLHAKKQKQEGDLDQTKKAQFAEVYSNVLGELEKSNIGESLLELNDTQYKLDRLSAEISSRKEQIYLDWCNYLNAKYHDKESKTKDYGIFWNAMIDIHKSIENDLRDLDSYKARIKKIETEINDVLNKKVNDLTISELFDFKKNQGETYHSPNEPVLLIEGIPIPESISLGLSYLKNIETSSDLFKFTIQLINYSNQKSKPFLFGWGISYFSHNLDNYDLELPIENPDINLSAPKSTKIKDFLDVKMFNGLTIISDSSKRYYEQSLKAFIKTLLKKEGLKLKRSDQTEEEVIPSTWEDLISTFNTQLPEIYKSEDNTNVLFVAYEHLKELANKQLLSQALSGFNNAFLTKFQTGQTPIFDPSEGVKVKNEKIVLYNNSLTDTDKFAPTPSYHFTPIVSGLIKEIELSLYDNWGIPTFENFKPDVANIVKSSFYESKSKDSMEMKPRVVQKSKIEFNWKLNDHSVKDEFALNSPIIGWILPNLLDNEILVYNKEGGALGKIVDNTWNNLNDQSDNLDNKYLENVINKMIINTSSLIDDLNDAQNRTDPGYQISSVDLLIGKPIAITRATIELVLDGLPALNQSINGVDANTKGGTSYPLEWKAKAGADWVNRSFSYRIGNDAKLGDGLLGYWFEDSDEFYSPLNNDVHQVKYNSREQNLILLVSPSLPIHITTGILPVKDLKLHNTWYEDVLKRIQAWFRVGPVIQPITPSELKENTSVSENELNKIQQPKLNVDLPEIEGFSWVWGNDEKLNKPYSIVPNQQQIPQQTIIKEAYLKLTSSSQTNK